MSIFAALHHRTQYKYDRYVNIGPQIVRLKPAPHCRTPIESYSLKIEPKDHFVNWQQDPFGNFQARLIFNKPAKEFVVEVNLVADMSVINPFDFFVDPKSEYYPFTYDEDSARDLRPFLATEPVGEKLGKWIASVDTKRIKTIDFLVGLNQRLEKEIDYTIRMEPGVQTPEQTLTLKRGSCRDSAWLLVQILRNLGLAARFVSGYLIQLKPDEKSLDGPSGTDHDFTDLHAWTEVYLPGGGWIGLDPTSGLLAGEGHIPLAATPQPATAAPISGAVDECETEFSFDMTVSRYREEPRVTKPYTDDQWANILNLGDLVDKRLEDDNVRLTQGGEPTFVSIDDMEGDEWNTAAVGPKKRPMSEDLVGRLYSRFAPGGLLHFGQGKWYPGEPLPRWSLACYWRTDGEPIWRNEALFARSADKNNHDVDLAETFAVALAERLGVRTENAQPAYEDLFYYLWKERRLPVNVDMSDSKVEQEEERVRLARLIENGIDKKVGYFLPLRRAETEDRWESGEWPVRSDQMFLLPGDSPMGLRLPLSSLPWAEEEVPQFPIDPLAARPPLRESLAQTPGTHVYQAEPHAYRQATRNGRAPTLANTATALETAENADELIRTAMCFEPRDGTLHIFMPPLEELEPYLELISKIEAVAEELDSPVIIEGYEPPKDHRVKHFRVTPDPGVIEVNVHPASNWRELVDITEGVYADARNSRLGTEKFDIDGHHTGTGGGNHLVMGAATPNESPFLRRPDLLRSLIGFWHNHPSLSYLFGGKFIGPTSQAPRVDEGRRDAIYELKIAFDQIPEKGECPPWLVDRVFRHLLVDGTGNTHRAEFCIDKLYSPDSSTGRLGLVELRGFEMPPHAQMSLTQQLLVRGLISHFWHDPYREEMVDWNTSLHDRFMLPHFVKHDFNEVITELRDAGFEFQSEWFAPHFEFRYPRVGGIAHDQVALELRHAIEPWYVLGEEGAIGGTARFVDSSVERMQVKVNGAIEGRHVVLCNGHPVPLHATGIEGEFVAGVRYRAWQPPSCLHPTIEVDDPLTFEIYDRWRKRSLGGCRYFVGHPGGGNSGAFPVNAFEAESRRGSRFHAMGHTGGKFDVEAPKIDPHYPLTLDIRREKAAANRS